jgi:hypothetical protein
VHDQECSIIIEQRKVYEDERSGREILGDGIATEEDIHVLDDIGKVALDCLNVDLEDQPDMTEVAEQLVIIRRTKKFDK